MRGQGRADDASIDKIKERLGLYAEKTLPILNYFETHTRYIFVRIDGEPSPEEVFAQVRNVLGE